MPLNYYGEYDFSVNVGVGSYLDLTTTFQWKFTLESVCATPTQKPYFAGHLPPFYAYGTQEIREGNSVMYDASIAQLIAVNP